MGGPVDEGVGRRKDGVDGLRAEYGQLSYEDVAGESWVMSREYASIFRIYSYLLYRGSLLMLKCWHMYISTYKCLTYLVQK